jgi:hypothetical protein
VKNRKKVTVLTLIGVIATLSFGRVDITTKNEDINLGINANAWMENGQFVYFFNKGAEKEHQWINRTFVNLGLDAVVKEHIKIELGIEGRMWMNVPKGGGTGQAVYNHRLNSTFIVERACGTYFLGDANNPLFAVTFGRFPYKYNQDVRNLGEYLFRSGTYPAYLINNFDLPFARVTGFKLSNNLGSDWHRLHQDLLLTFETDIPPYYDGSLTYIGDYTLGGFLTLGAGVQFAHLISVDENQTTPKRVQGSSSPTTRNLYVVDGDTGHYTFRGAKVMGRLSFSIIGALRKILSNDLAFFGAEDGKIFGELAILGVKSYPRNDSLNSSLVVHNNIYGYDSLKNKIPIAFGLNWPTHPLLSYTVAPAMLALGLRKDGQVNSKAVTLAAASGALSGVGLWLLEKKFNVKTGLDVLALEFEWYGCTYANNYYNQLGVGPGQSYPIPDFSPYFDYTHDNWRWSVYAKKMFADDRFGVVAQLARDHIRTETIVDEGADLEQALRQPKHFWWMVKLLASF